MSVCCPSDALLNRPGQAGSRTIFSSRGAAAISAGDLFGFCFVTRFDSKPKVVRLQCDAQHYGSAETRTVEEEVLHVGESLASRHPSIKQDVASPNCIHDWLLRNVAPVHVEPLVMQDALNALHELSVLQLVKEVMYPDLAKRLHFILVDEEVAIFFVPVDGEVRLKEVQTQDEVAVVPYRASRGMDRLPRSAGELLSASLRARNMSGNANRPHWSA